METRGKRIFKAAALGGVVFLVFTLFGAYPGTGRAAPDTSTFVVLTRNQPRALDPAIGSDYPHRKIFVAVYEPLVEHKLGTADAENLQGALAESWSISPDGLKYTFRLRRGVRFHDGTTLDAEDVVVSFDRMRKINLGYSYILTPVREVRAVGAMAVEISLTQLTPGFLLGLPLIQIVSADAVRKNEREGDLAQGWFRRNEAGTGPYTVTEFVIGERIVLERFGEYWRGSSGCHLSRMVFRVVPEAVTQRVLIEGGEGDWADSIESDDLVAMAKSPKFIVTSEPTWYLSYLMMNTKRPPLDNKLVRRALRYAFPYRRLIFDAMRGRGIVPRGLIPPNFPGWGGPEEVTDLSATRRLLQQAGFSGPAKLDLIYFTPFAFNRAGAELLDANLRNLGIQLELRGLPFPTMLDLMTNPDPLKRPHLSYFASTPEYADPDDLVFKTFSSRSPHWSRIGYSNAEVDRFVDAARRTTDQIQRAELYRNAVRIINDDSPAIYTVVRLTDHVFSSRVQGWVYHPPFGGGAIPYYNLCLR